MCRHQRHWAPHRAGPCVHPNQRCKCTLEQPVPGIPWDTGREGSVNTAASFNNVFLHGFSYIHDGSPGGGREKARNRSHSRNNGREITRLEMGGLHASALPHTKGFYFLQEWSSKERIEKEPEGFLWKTFSSAPAVEAYMVRETQGRGF